MLAEQHPASNSEDLTCGDAGALLDEDTATQKMPADIAYRFDAARRPGAAAG